MRDKPFDGLNMVPFIDIMLVLLTIVLTTSSFIASGRIPVHLPQASAQGQAPESAQTLEMDASGSLHYQGQALSLAALHARLNSLSRNTPFVLRADRSVALQSFVEVVDALQQLGFSRVAVQTEATGR